MKELKIFNNPEFGDVKTMLIDGEPWFVGKDVARALGYGKGRSLQNAVARHVDPEDRGVTEMMTPGGKQNIVIINESGVYALTFGSKLDSARKFKRWVTSEVLPTLRKTCRYEMEQSRRTVKVYNGSPVVTLSDIDTYHKLTPGTAGRCFMRVFDQFTLDEDFYLGDPVYINETFGYDVPLDKPVALLKQHTYELSMFTEIPLYQIKTMVPGYFVLPEPKIVECAPYVASVESQPVAMIEQKPSENLVSELIIPKRHLRDKIDLAFSAYAATYNYYRSGGRAKVANLHNVEGYGYLEGIGSQILGHASHYAWGAYGPLTMRPDEDPHFCFPISSIRKDGKITIPKIGLFELKTPLWIEEGHKPVTATVRRTKDNKYLVEIRRR